MNFKAVAEDKEEEKQQEMIEEMPTTKEEPKVAPVPAQVTQDDLFSAHDFDITIDLEVPLPSTYTINTKIGDDISKEATHFGISVDLSVNSRIIFTIIISCSC